MRAWLASYAPESAIVQVQRDELPPEAIALGEDQRVFLGGLAIAAEHEQPRGGDAWQTLLFRVAGEAGLAPGRAFGALYLAFLGRPNGPRAGWLLASLDAAFVVGRLREAAGWRDHAGDGTPGGGAAPSEEAGT